MQGGAVGGQRAGGGLLEGGDGGGQCGPGGGPDRGVLAAEQLAGLDVPGQEFGVEEQPSGVQVAEQAGLLGGLPDPVGQVRGQGGGEEGAAGPGPDRAAGVGRGRWGGGGG